MSRPVITSVGILNPLGLGRDEFVAAWDAGRSAEQLPSDNGPGGMQLPRFKAQTWFPEHRTLLRRMDRLSRMTCVAAGLARDDAAGLGETEELGLAIGTDLGTLEETWKFLIRLRDKGPALANPMDFPNLVPNAGAGYLGILLGLKGPSQTFCDHETCGDQAVAWAAEGVASDWFPGALAGSADELGPVRASATAAIGCALPGEVQGEGSSALLIESEGRARKRGAPVLARHLGFRSATFPGRSPLTREVDALGLEGLIRQALAEAGVGPRDVGLALLSHPHDPDLNSVLDAALERSVPRTDHAGRWGFHAGDGAMRIALSSLLLANRALRVNAGGQLRDGSVALVLSVSRGGGACVSILGEHSS